MNAKKVLSDTNNFKPFARKFVMNFDIEQL